MTTTVAFLKAVIRGFFAVETLLYIGVLVVGIHGVPQNESYSGRVIYITSAFSAARVVLFGSAFWTTRRPHAKPKFTAIAACVVNIAQSFYLLHYVLNLSAEFTAILWLVSVINFFGIIAFARREAEICDSEPDPRIEGGFTSPATDRIIRYGFLPVAWFAVSPWYSWARVHGVPMLPALESILSVVLAGLVCAFLHESGHAIAALSLGMKLLRFNLGPIGWEKKEGRWRVFFSRGIFSGGDVFAVPTDPSYPEWHSVAFTSTAPLVNFATAPLFLWATFWVVGTPYQLAWYFLAIAASLSILLPVYNLFPFRTLSGHYSDGACLLQIAMRSPVAAETRLSLLTNAVFFSSMRIRDLDPFLFERAIAATQSVHSKLWTFLWLSHIYEDSGRIPEARAVIASIDLLAEQHLAELPPRTELVLALFHALRNHDAGAACIWWRRIEAKRLAGTDYVAQDAYYWLASSAIDWTEGHSLEANESWRNAQAMAQNLPSSGVKDFLCDRIDLLRTLLDQSVNWISL